MPTGRGGPVKEQADDIDAEEITIFENISKEPFRQRFRVQRSGGQQIEFHLFPGRGEFVKPAIGHQYVLENLQYVKRGRVEYLRNTNSTTIRDITQPGSGTRLMIVGDTHIGYGHRPKADRHYSYQEGDYFKSFKNIVKNSIDNNLDGIIHTGDIFDGPVSDKEFQWVKEGIQILSEKDIGFAFVKGNHDRDCEISKLTELDNVMHIGGGQQHEVEGFDLYGYDSEDLSDIKDLDFKSISSPSIIISHPEDTYPDENELSKAFQQFDSRSYIFLGHHHVFNEYSFNNIRVVFTGSPAGINSSNNPTAYQVKLIDNFVSDPKVTSIY